MENVPSDSGGGKEAGQSSRHHAWKAGEKAAHFLHAATQEAPGRFGIFEWPQTRWQTVSPRIPAERRETFHVRFLQKGHPDQVVQTVPKLQSVPHES